MTLPQAKFLGGPLRTGWHRPTEELVRKYQQFLREGLAPPSAPQLYRPAHDASKSDLSTDAVQQLASYMRPESALKAVGMAYPQLAIAEVRSIRVVAAQTSMRDLRAESRTANATVLLNPNYAPVVSAGQELRVEACFSAPGMGVRVRRWREIDLTVDGRTTRMGGTYAWILQHEIDHLEGILCTDVAYRQRGQVYYVPPEWYKLFVGNGFGPGWPTMAPQQYDAIRSGDFDLADYAELL